MARSVELRTRAAIHGDGAWRSFMHVEGRSLKLYPEEDDLDKAVDLTTLSPKSMLQTDWKLPGPIVCCYMVLRKPRLMAELHRALQS